MATKKENATRLHELLGLTLNPDKSAPNADTLADWATRAETDADGVKREIYAFQLEDKLDVALPEGTDAATLEQWLALPDDEARAAIQAARPDGSAGPASTERPPQPGPSTPPAADTVQVRVNATIAGYGGTFTDPDQTDPANRVITDRVVTVEKTAAVTQALRQHTLIEG